MSETFTVTLKRKGTQFEVKEGQRVLEAALEQGVKLTYACRSGTCKACMVRVLEGEIFNDAAACPTLFPFERQQGKRLTCIGYVKGPVVIDR
jgi:ferredoxin